MAKIESAGDGHLAATYTLIYSFLTQRSHTKAAQALKKAAKHIVVLKDGMEQKGPSLPDILKQWKSLKKDEDSSSSSEDDDSSDSDSSEEDDSSSSSDDSDSDSDSGSSSDDSDSKSSTVKQAPVKELVKPGTEKLSKSSWPIPVSSPILSSSDSEDEPAKKTLHTPAVNSIPAKPSPAKKGSSSSSPSPSSSSTSSSSDSEPETVVQTPADTKFKEKTKPQAPVSNSDSSSDGGSSSESESDSSDDEKQKTKGAKKKEETVGSLSIPSSAATKTSPSRSSQTLSSPSKVSDKASNPDSSTSESDASNSSHLSKKKKSTKPGSKKAKSPSPPARKVDQDSVRIAKKRKTSESGTSVPTTTISTNDSVPVTNKKSRNGKSPRKVNNPFSRIKLNEIKFADERLKDNTFHARGAATGDYGVRAHQDLIVTRGAGFRKEKNKKKKGSYKGGNITMASHSIKFTD